MDKVSVIIPNYNHSLYLKQRIDSVLDQSYQRIEVIILDDCSTDKSREVIEAYRNHPKVSHIIYNEANSGSTFKQWMRGLDVATGNFVWIAESDDVADTSFLQTAIDALSRNKTAGMVQTRSYYYTAHNETQGVCKVYDTPYDWDTDFCENGRCFARNAMLINNSLINASAIVFRKKAIADAMSDTHFKLNGDWFLYLTVLLKYDFCHIGKPLNYFRQHDNKGSSRNILNFNNLKEYAEIIHFLFQHFDLTDSQKNTLRFVFVQKWLEQNSNSMTKLLSNKFISISQKAFSNDRLFMLRLLKRKIGR